METLLQKPVNEFSPMTSWIENLTVIFHSRLMANASTKVNSGEFFNLRSKILPV